MSRRFDGIVSTPWSAMVVVFSAYGLGMGLWGGSVAVVAARASVSPVLLGAAFTAFTVLYLAGMTGTGVLARHVSLRTLLHVVGLATGLALAVLMLADSPALLIGGLCLLGITGGALDLSMNTEATRVEAELGRPILAGLHGAASLGFAGASICGSLLAVGIGPWICSLLAVAIHLLGLGAVRRATPQRGLPAKRLDGEARARPTMILVTLGLVIGLSIAGETAAAMFSAPFLTLQAPELAALAGAGAAAFALCQALVRFRADRLRARLGDPMLLSISLALAVLGFVIVALSPGFWVSAAGFSVIGVGTACVVPCVVALAVARSPLSAASALAVASLVSGLPRIPTPYLFGEIVARFSYGAAFTFYAALLLVAFVLTAALLRRGPK